MLKPFYNKKKNIDDRLLPSATAADVGKLVGVIGEGKFGLVEGGGGDGSVYPEIKIKFTTENISPVEVPAHSIVGIINSDQTPFAVMVTRESFILPENGEVNCSNDLIFLAQAPFDLSHIIVSADFIEDFNQRIQTITGAIKPIPDSDLYFLYDQTEISIKLTSK